MLAKLRAVRTRADSISMFIDAHATGPTSSRVAERGPGTEPDRDDPNLPTYPPAEATPETPAPRIRLEEEPGDFREGTLSNRKLGRNQQVLSQQIEELGAMLKEMRAEMRSMQEHHERIGSRIDEA